MDRRILLTLLGAAACVPVHEWLIARPEADAAVAHSSGSALSVGIVDHLDDIVGQLRRMDDQISGSTLLPLVRAHLRHVFELLDQRRYTDTVGRRLHATAAELLRLSGWSAFEDGHHPQAQRYWFAALLDLRAAEARAHDRAAIECHRALDSAFDRLGDAPGSSGEPDWCYWLDEAQPTPTPAPATYTWRTGPGPASTCVPRYGCRIPALPATAHCGTLMATIYLRQDQPEIDHVASWPPGRWRP